MHLMKFKKKNIFTKYENDLDASSIVATLFLLFSIIIV